MKLKRNFLWLFAFSWIVSFSIFAQPSAAAPIRLSVDAREAPRGLFHAHLTIPVKPGPLTLVYPEWLPGEHGPTGPNIELAGLKFAAAGKRIAWHRDPVDMYSFHCDVPAGAETLDVSLDYLSPSATISGNGYGFTPNATAELAIVLWNQLLLYPLGRPATQIDFQSSLKLPGGWKFGTPLPVTKQTPDEIEFETVSLDRLVDSPLIAGAHFRVVSLSTEKDATVEIDMAADSEAALDMSPDLEARYKKMVAEASALYRVHHYRHYHFLLTLSDVLDSNGLEHHEASDDRVPERMLIDPVLRLRHADLLPHEYTHSWNGKYRRPAGLATSDYQQPMKGNLLWVYEGGTQYLGSFVLTARSGLRTPEQTHEYLASVAARLNTEPGRTWRPLEDTAVAAQLLYGAPEEWATWRRGVDFYEEGLLIWLDADTLIRQLTHGERSFDDFCRSFYGGEADPYTVKPYTFNDVVNALNAVAPYDWKTFLTERLQSTAPHAPLGGIERGGWKLVYNDAPNDHIKNEEAAGKFVDLSYSLGMVVNDDGTVRDVVPGLPADKAGVAPGMKLIAVNGRKWSPDILHEALKAAKSSTTPLNLLLENHEFFKGYKVNYHEGDRYPHLEREAGKPDLLDQIIKPLT